MRLSLFKLDGGPNDSRKTELFLAGKGSVSKRPDKYLSHGFHPRLLATMNESPADG